MEHKLGSPSFWLRAVAILAVVFGVLTIKSGGEVVFGNVAARMAAGNFVPFVVWFKFLAGLFYVAAGTALTLTAFGTHIAAGGAYEMRTVWALSLRLAVWTAIAFLAWRVLWVRCSPRP